MREMEGCRMAAHKSPMEKSIRRMIRDGKTSKEIMEWTGVCSKTVAKYRKEVQGEKDSSRAKVICPANYPPNFKKDWTVAVNRLRRYMGKRAFPMPKED